MEFSATTVRIGRVRLVGCGEPEPQEGHAMAGRGSRESCGLRRDLRWLPEFASESGSGHSKTSSANTRAINCSPRIIARDRRKTRQFVGNEEIAFADEQKRNAHEQSAFPDYGRGANKELPVVSGILCKRRFRVSRER